MHNYCPENKRKANQNLDLSFFVGTINAMNNRRGRPSKGSDQAKADYLEVRLEVAAKKAFREAAKLSGLALSEWVRQRLRRAARTELEDAGRQVAFLSIRDELGCM